MYKTVKVTKIEKLPGRPDGIGQVQPITEGYNLIGEAWEDPVVGKSYAVERRIRNGVTAYGLFETSDVKEVDVIDERTTIITTHNSKYRIELQ